MIQTFATEMTEQNTMEFATTVSCLKQTPKGDYSRATVSDVIVYCLNPGTMDKWREKVRSTLKNGE